MNFVVAELITLACFIFRDPGASQVSSSKRAHYFFFIETAMMTGDVFGFVPDLTDQIFVSQLQNYCLTGRTEDLIILTQLMFRHLLAELTDFTSQVGILRFKPLDETALVAVIVLQLLDETALVAVIVLQLLDETALVAVIVLQLLDETALVAVIVLQLLDETALVAVIVLQLLDETALFVVIVLQLLDETALVVVDFHQMKHLGHELRLVGLQDRQPHVLPVQVEGGGGQQWGVWSQTQSGGGGRLQVAGVVT